jgi:hypothetical protein
MPLARPPERPIEFAHPTGLAFAPLILYLSVGPIYVVKGQQVPPRLMSASRRLRTAVKKVRAGN